MAYNDYNYINYESIIREILIELAHKRKSITYSKLLIKSGIHDDVNIATKIKKPFLFNVLKSILEYEVSKDRPLLTIIVFLDDNIKEPSSKFYIIAEELGLKDKNIKNETFFKDKLEEVYGIWGDNRFYDYYKFQ